VSIIIPIVLCALAIGLICRKLNAAAWMIMLAVIAAVIGWYAAHH